MNINNLNYSIMDLKVKYDKDRNYVFIKRRNPKKNENGELISLTRNSLVDFLDKLNEPYEVVLAPSLSSEDVLILNSFLFKNRNVKVYQMIQI